MIIPMRSARVIIRPLASSVAYPFFIARPETNVPRAFKIQNMGIETISTGYMLMEGGAGSTVEFISGTRPIPMNRPDIAVAHALAGQYLGMNMIYLEAGSGAKEPVANEVVKAVTDVLDIPVIAGGGIRDTETVSEKVKAGASIIVTGTVIEEKSDLMKEMADAVHWK